MCGRMDILVVLAVIFDDSEALNLLIYFWLSSSGCAKLRDRAHSHRSSYV